MMTALYEEDFVLWTEKTAELLKRKEFDRVDWENLIRGSGVHGKKRETGNNEFINRFNRTSCSNYPIGNRKRTECPSLDSGDRRLSDRN
jgi:hypothetical protein